MWMEIAHSFQSGDTYIYVMLGIAFFGLVIFFERLIMLQFVFNLNFQKFLVNLKKMIKAEDFDRAASFCKAAGKSALPLISLRALQAAEIDPSTIRGTIEEEAINFLPRLEARVSTLPMLGTLILLCGILGTINALWAAFHAVEVLDTAQKQALAGEAIANSLTYSALGVLICMFFFAANQIIKGMAIKLSERIQLGVLVLQNLLAPQQMSFVAAGTAPAVSSLDQESHSAPVSTETHAPVSHATQESEPTNEKVEEASVEDIKDEEEII